jgi:hypothetical protein
MNDRPDIFLHGVITMVTVSGYKSALSVMLHSEISTHEFYCKQKGDLSFVARLYIPVLFLLLFAWYPIMAQPRIPHTSHPECPKSSTLHGYDQK